MNLYLISQYANGDYDTYDAAVVAAETEDEARMIHPSGPSYETPAGSAPRDSPGGSWTCADNVAVKLIGTALADTPKGVLLVSYNAG